MVCAGAYLPLSVPWQRFTFSNLCCAGSWPAALQHCSVNSLQQRSSQRAPLRYTDLGVDRASRPGRPPVSSDHPGNSSWPQERVRITGSTAASHLLKSCCSWLLLIISRLRGRLVLWRSMSRPQHLSKYPLK